MPTFGSGPQCRLAGSPIVRNAQLRTRAPQRRLRDDGEDDGVVALIDYDLHKLGWRAFQDLCAVILQGVAQSRFRRSQRCQKVRPGCGLTRIRE